MGQSTDVLSGLLTDVDGTAPFVWVALCVTLVLGAASAIRIVPEHERIVISRFGRVVRTAGPGVAVRIPAVERTATVSVRPANLRLTVSACTLDGVPILLLANAVCRVTDPALSLLAATDPQTATATALESGLEKEVSRTDLASLLDACRHAESAVPAAVAPTTASWGVEVTSLEVTLAQAVVTPGLLRYARREPPAGKKRHPRPSQVRGERRRP